MCSISDVKRTSEGPHHETHDAYLILAFVATFSSAQSDPCQSLIGSAYYSCRHPVAEDVVIGLGGSGLDRSIPASVATPPQELTRIKVLQSDGHKVGVPLFHQSFISHVTVSGNDGKQYTIRCAAHTEWKRCLSPPEGFVSPAMIENNDTLWISYRDSTNHNKPSRAKYEILQREASSTPFIETNPTEILRVSTDWSIGARYVIDVMTANNSVEKQTVTVLRLATLDEWLTEYSKHGSAPSPQQLALARLPAARFYEVNGWAK